jgi:hypothetical protein
MLLGQRETTAEDAQRSAHPDRKSTFMVIAQICVIIHQQNLAGKARFPGRVPHVRPSVHGPKKTGRSPFQRFCYAGKKD